MGRGVGEQEFMSSVGEDEGIGGFGEDENSNIIVVILVPCLCGHPTT